MFNANLALQQLGFSQSRLKIMIGAKNFLQSSEHKYVQFDYKMDRKANCIQIQLNEISDTYNMIWFKKGNKMDKEVGIRLPYCKEVKRIEGVYCDMLRELFEQNTGLYLSL